MGENKGAYSIVAAAITATAAIIVGWWQYGPKAAPQQPPAAATTVAANTPAPATNGTTGAASTTGTVTPPAPAQKPPDEESVCRDHIKQVALAVILFTSDYDDYYDFSGKRSKTQLGGWPTAVKPYMKSQDAWSCPLTNENPAYSFNTNLLDASQSEIDEPARTVMVYEGKDQVLDYRHNGLAAVAFCDGHTKMCSPSGAESLIWTVKSNSYTK